MCCLLLSWKAVSNQGLSAIGTAGSVITMNPEVWVCARFKQSLDEEDTSELDDSPRGVHEQVLKPPQPTAHPRTRENR